MAIDNEVPNDLAKGVPSFPGPSSEAEKLDARTDWIAEQRADVTILFVFELLKRGSHPDFADIELNPQLKLYIMCGRN